MSRQSAGGLDLVFRSVSATSGVIRNRSRLMLTVYSDHVYDRDDEVVDRTCNIGRSSHRQMLPQIFNLR
jgi:hypothetical protein